MRLDKALAKIGVKVVRVDQSEGIDLYLRTGLGEPINKKRWVHAASQFVIRAEKAARGPAWSAEVAKVLFHEHSTVKFLWRVSLRGNTQQAQRHFGECVLEALRTGIEVTRMPLVGQKKYPYDPAKGKIMGGYKRGEHGSEAESLIASGFNSGVPS